MSKTDKLTADDVEAAPAPSDKDLTAVRELALHQVALIKDIIETEQKLAKLNAEYKRNTEVDLPTKLKELGLESFTLKGGHEIKLKELVAASIPKGADDAEAAANAAAAHEWLESRGHGGLIKHRIEIFFGRGDEAWAQKFIRDCRQRKRPLDLKRKDWVEPQTLSAFVREQLGHARELGADPEEFAPTKLLGVYHVETATVAGPNVPKRGRKSRSEG